MFEKYTQEARRAVFFARNEALQAGHSFISAEHLLVGMLYEEGTRIEQLFQLRQHETKIREQLYRFIPKHESLSNNQDLPLSDQSKQVLAFAAEESDTLCDKCIDAEHLLLGILRLRDLTATKCLNQLGLTLEQARERVRLNPVPGRVRAEAVSPTYTAPIESRLNFWGLVFLLLLALVVILLALRLR